MYFNRFAIDAIAFICALSVCVVTFADSVGAQAGWKEDWEKTLRSAEAEGQLTLYGCCYEYDRILERFKKQYPKIKVTSVLGAGGNWARGF
jgi:basic membrane lipoprotein Med (substrate-binding protein (PBP1-ABC) superfamily)